MLKISMTGSAAVVAYYCNAPGERFGPTALAIVLPELYLAQRCMRALVLNDPTAKFEMWSPYQQQ